MAKDLTEGKIMQALGWAYTKAVDGGIPGFSSAQVMAEDYLSKGGTVNDQVNSLIKWQITKAGTSGFINGLGGIITLPITVPANIASVMYVQILCT